MALVVAAYLPALRGVFLWDDVTIVQNPLLESPSGLLSIWFSPAQHALEDHYWPVTYTTFWVERQLWGLWAPGYHGTNLLLHAGNVLLLYGLLRRLEIPGAWMAAALFGLHPVHVESVAWVIERKDVLSTAFYLGSVIAWVRFTELRRRPLYLLSLALFAAGMLSKSVVVTLPAALWILTWWRSGRVGRQEALLTLPFFAVGLAVACADVLFVSRISSWASGLSPAERLLAAGRSFWFYLGQLVWPAQLLAIYPRWEPTASKLVHYLAPAAVLVLLAGSFALRRQLGRGPAAAAAFYLLTLLPTLGFIDFSFMRLSFVADRYQYLASAAPLLLLGAGVSRLASDRPAAHRNLAAALFLIPLAVLTWRQCLLYQNPVAFWAHTARHNPAAWEAHHQLGLMLAGEGELAEGIASVREAVRIKPDYAEAHSNLGVLLAQSGRLPDAARQFEEALRHRPDLRDAQANLRRARAELEGPAETAPALPGPPAAGEAPSPGVFAPPAGASAP